MTSKVEHLHRTNRNFQMPSLFFCCCGMVHTGLWDIKGSEGYIYAILKKMYQMKLSQE